MFRERERRYLETARIGRLATADGDGRPAVVPICFTLVDDLIVTPVDEKPQDVPPEALRRVRDIEANPRVALVVDHYTADWSQLGWVQVRGTASRCAPGAAAHRRGRASLRDKYDQYATHDLAERPQIHIEPGSVRSWGQLDRPAGAGDGG